MNHIVISEKGCVGAMFVYDVTRPKTFAAIEDRWLADFKKYVKKEGAYILIGNKIDLEDQRVISTEEGQKLADKINASAFVETSAKKNVNVEKAFESLVHQVLRNYGEDI
ncbi:MAG: hypothetical protein ACTSQS_02870 [Promethearchaeota archaeon]